MRKITNTTKKLIIKHQNFVKYLISGGTAAVVEFSLFNLIFYFLLREQLMVAQVLSYLSGMLTAFTLHHFWTFKSNGEKRHSSHRQFVMYATVSILNLFISSFLLVQLKTIGLYPWLAKLIVMGIVVLWNFLILNKIIFGSAKNER